MLEILIAEKIYKTYNNSFIDRVHSEKRNEVLKGVDLTVGEGECIGIMGKSGCGKTTLLKILGTIEKASSLCVSGSSKISWISGNRGFRTRKI